MKVAVLVYRPAGETVEAVLVWADPFANQVLKLIPVPVSPNLGIFADLDCSLISYSEYPEDSARQEYLEVYRLSDWSLQTRLPMDCRAHFNVSPQWSTFLPSPDNSLIYIYKSRTLRDHHAQDFICGLDVDALTLSSWNFQIPECVAGWSVSGGRAHAQMLFVADGVEVGRLPYGDLEQKAVFWLGPDEGMGPAVPLGSRPRVHSDLGHARAILYAPKRTLSVVVCTDGTTHLIDPIDFRYLERQQLRLRKGFAMPIFAAQLDPQGRFLYVGTATGENRHQGLVERIVVHDLEQGKIQSEWVLEEPFVHMTLTGAGDHICGVSLESNKLYILESRMGQAEAVMQLDGSPQYVISAS